MVPKAEESLGIRLQWFFFKSNNSKSTWPGLPIRNIIYKYTLTFSLLEKPENPLKLGLEKVIQNIENPERETYKMPKMLRILSGKSPEVPKPMKTIFVQVFSQSDSSSSSEDSAYMSYI